MRNSERILRCVGEKWVVEYRKEKLEEQQQGEMRIVRRYDKRLLTEAFQKVKVVGTRKLDLNSTCSNVSSARDFAGEEGLFDPSNCMVGDIEGERPSLSIAAFADHCSLTVAYLVNQSKCRWRRSARIRLASG